MAQAASLLASALVLLASSLASAAVVEHTFHVQNLTLNRLCSRQVIAAVNGSLPGPTIQVHEGDTLIVHVYNESPYNITIHWHGVFQKLSGWADGPNMVTQCPIQPGSHYTYKFTITGQEGTLWWHAHVSFLRAWLHGALIILPRPGTTYPFPKPYREVPILFGEWWNGNVVDIENNALATGAAPNISDAYTINGCPGDLYNCSTSRTYTLKVEKGKTYLLRLINAALNNQLFFKIANHMMTVVAIDASYTKPYVTDVVVTGPGQTVDVLLTADQPIGYYYMAARPYASAAGVQFDNTTTRGIIEYVGAAKSSLSAAPTPALPAFNDTPTADKFYTNITGMTTGPHYHGVASKVDLSMYITIGLGLDRCTANATNATCQGPISGTRFSASMNNESFVAPSTLSILQAFFFNVGGVYTTDFPTQPPVAFDYTNSTGTLTANQSVALAFAPKGTKVTKVKYNSTVEIIFQNTAILGVESHPMHLHGFNFHVLAQGFGNFDPNSDPQKYNLVDPQMRNTIAVPVGGWAVIRFKANNPGVWLLHCHLDAHLPWGLATAFVIENGGTPESTLPPPPHDLPIC